MKPYNGCRSEATSVASQSNPYLKKLVKSHGSVQQIVDQLENDKCRFVMAHIRMSHTVRGYRRDKGRMIDRSSVFLLSKSGCDGTQIRIVCPQIRHFPLTLESLFNVRVLMPN